MIGKSNNVKLQLGSTTQTVSIQAAAAQVDTTTTTQLVLKLSF